MFYNATEISKLLTYKHPQSFLLAVKNKKSELVNRMWEERIPAKVGRQILWRKEAADAILKEFKLYPEEKK